MGATSASGGDTPQGRVGAVREQAVHTLSTLSTRTAGLRESATRTLAARTSSMRGSGNGASSSPRSTQPPQPAGPTLVALVGSAGKDLSAIVRDEVQLAKTEVKDDVKHAAIGAGMFGVAGVVALLASILLSFAIVYVLVELGLDTWLSFLIVGAVYLLVAGLLAFLGLRQVKQVKAPQQAIDSTKETVAVLKGAAKPGR